MSQADAKPEGIGQVAMNDGSVVTLLGVDEWRVTVNGEESPELAASYQSFYEGAYTGDPVGGEYGQAILRDLASRSGGTLTMFEQLEPAPADVVF